MNLQNRWPRENPIIKVNCVCGWRGKRKIPEGQTVGAVFIKGCPKCNKEVWLD